MVSVRTRLPSLNSRKCIHLRKKRNRSDEEFIPDVPPGPRSSEVGVCWKYFITLFFVASAGKYTVLNKNVQHVINYS